MKITKENLKTLIKEELDAMLQLEVFDTGSDDLEEKKKMCAEAGGEWVSEASTGSYGHCSKPVAEGLGTGEPSRLAKVGGRASSAVKSKTEAGSGELALAKIKAELDELKGDARVSGIANVLGTLGIGKDDLRRMVPKA
jgi:hypothetical protein